MNWQFNQWRRENWKKFNVFPSSELRNWSPVYTNREVHNNQEERQQHILCYYTFPKPLTPVSLNYLQLVLQSLPLYEHHSWHEDSVMLLCSNEWYSNFISLSRNLIMTLSRCIIIYHNYLFETLARFLKRSKLIREDQF